MNSSSISLGAIASFLALCQWFVLLSARKLLLRKCEAVGRGVAYPVLIGFGLITILAVRLEFGSEIFRPGTVARQLAAITIFSYLGCILLLSLFFLIIRAMDFLIKFVSTVARSTIRARSGSELGSTSSFGARRRKEQQREPRCNDVLGLLTSGSGGDIQLDMWNPTRRSFLKGAAASSLMAAAGLGASGIAEAYSEPIVEKYALFSHRLEADSKPVTLIHMTDCHFGMFFGRRELRSLVEHLNSLQGDALCITGDVFHSARAVPEQATPLLKRLRARLLGNFAVLGNHDVYAGEIRSMETLKAAGICVLRNEWVTVVAGSSRIHVGGIDDPTKNRKRGPEFPGFDLLMKRAPAESGVRILLSHRPGVFPSAARREIDLVLAGHTHGGQVVIPIPGRERGISVADMVSEYTHGWYESGASRMYLNRGVGLTFLPWRIQCPPEISVIRLTPLQKRAKRAFVRRV